VNEAPSVTFAIGMVIASVTAGATGVVGAVDEGAPA
jgi:hypothetical protein